MKHFYQNVEGWFSDADCEFYKFAVTQLPEKGVFVELGSWKGRSSSFLAVELINSGKNIELVCVDTWKGSTDMQHDPTVRAGIVYDIFLQNIAPVKTIIKPIKTTTIEAAKSFKDNSVDCVFIDAEHDYKSVLADIKAWLPKIKEGGIISGHDIAHKPVADAVSDSFEAFSTIGNCWYVVVEKDESKK